MKKILAAGLFFGIFWFFAVAFAQSKEVPTLIQRVTDFTNTLSFQQWRALEQKLRQFEDATSTQIAVLLIPTLGNESLEDYSLRVAEKNEIGRAGKNNGALLLVVQNDRKIRIEVGYGLEGVLPDASSSQIIRRVVAPKFRNGDFYGGLSAGIDAIISATRGEYKADEHTSSNGEVYAGFFLIMAFVVVLILWNFLRLFRMPQYIGSSRGWMYSSGWGGSGWSSGNWGGGGGWSGGGGSFGGGGASGGW